MKMKKIVAVLLVASALTGCYREPRTLSLDHSGAYIYTENAPSGKISENDQELFEQFSPVFVVEEDQKSFNKIGQPKIKRGPQDKLEAVVDPSAHPIFVQKTTFVTKKGHYTNLVYRVHFEKVPYGLMPLQVTAGKNVGLLVIITLDQNQMPVLVTSVHTCGCYISMVPTNYLPLDSFPRDWKDRPLYRYGEKYPAMLHYPCPLEKGAHPVFFLRSKTHRVADIFVEKIAKVQAQYHPQKMEITPMCQLDSLPIEGEEGKLSFYYNDLSKGYVRNSLKPFEFLIMSWWAFDLNVGNDKKYAPARELHKRFYTSLNPAYWVESDLWNFPVAAKFWGWEL